MDQNIIEVEEADAHLRLSLDSPDPRTAELESKLDQAVSIVYDYLKTDVPDMADSPTPVVGHHIKAAILIVLTGLWDGRDPSVDLITPAVVRLLARSRDPALA